MVLQFPEALLESLTFFFADDCLLLFKANPMESRVFKDILDEYAAALGQVINFDKSTISFSKNVNEEMQEMVGEVIGVKRGESWEIFGPSFAGWEE